MSNRNRLAAAVLPAALVMVTGCRSSSVTPDQKQQATDQWNSARAGALTNLATDQFRDGSFEKCQQTVDQALRLTPDSLPLHLLAARLTIEQGQTELAEAHLARAKQIDPNSAEADYLSGTLFEHWHQPAKAADAYAAAATKDPHELAYPLAQADMLVATGKTADAVTLLTAKLDAFPHSGVLQDEIGQLLQQQNKPADALPYQRTAATLCPDDATVREHLAFGLVSAGQYAEASDVFDRLLATPDGAKRPDLQAASGDCLARTGRFTESQHAYDVATRLAPSTAGYWLGLAKADAQLNDYPAADVAVRRAVSLDATSNPAQCLLGYVRMKQNKPEAALEAFRTAASLDANDTLSVCMQGHLLAQLGRQAEAKACYSKALRLDPNDPLATRLCNADD